MNLIESTVLWKFNTKLLEDDLFVRHTVVVEPYNAILTHHRLIEVMLQKYSEKVIKFCLRIATNAHASVMKHYSVSAAKSLE